MCYKFSFPNTAKSKLYFIDSDIIYHTKTLRKYQILGLTSIQLLDRIPRPEVERLLCNYNTIYELNFPSAFMADAVKRAVVEDTIIDFKPTEIISLDILLKILGGNPA